MEFQSEPGIHIDGKQFKLVTRDWIDHEGTVKQAVTAWGCAGNTCAWFFVPPSERARLESLGVVFDAE
jgi:hypothetical protein